ncbi:MAG: polysaccharide deacetylase family protein [Blastocatellia bacterium]|nr:polysaccharide deacetylase family protein [Blastocatellia bacterium]
MIAGGVTKMRRYAGRVRRSLWRRSLILLYHRVEEVWPDPWGLAVSPANFRDHLEVIRGYGAALSLSELVESLSAGKVPRKGIVLTFDDGYADNLNNAKPLLEEFGIPATVFVATGYIGGQREFWWDALDNVFLQPNTLPGELRLRISGSEHQWDLGDAAVYTAERTVIERESKEGRGAAGVREKTYQELWKLLHPLTDVERRITLGELQSWSGVDPSVRPSHRLLSREEVRKLDEGDLVEVGAHSVTHSSLGSLTRDDQVNEIRECKSVLEDILERPVTNFAYPFGKDWDFNQETIDAVREAGFGSACSTTRTHVGRDADLFRLPRVVASDLNAEQFDRFLFDLFNG